MALASSLEYRLKNILIGSSCSKCASYGIICRQNGMFLSEGGYGQTTVDVGGIGSFRVPGRIADCKILTGESPEWSATLQIKARAQQEKDRVVEEIVEEAINNLGTMDLDSRNWS